MLLCAVPLAKLLHLVTALQRGLGRRRENCATAGGGGGHVIPVGSLQIGAAESVPAVPIGQDQGLGLVLSPARWWDPAGFGLRGGHGCRGEGEGEGEGGKRWFWCVMVVGFVDIVGWWMR